MILAFFAMAKRPDVLKVFIGSLHNDINKPQLMKLCQFCQLDVANIHVPRAKPHKLAIAFLEFWHPEEALVAVERLDGLEDRVVTDGYLHVFRVFSREPSSV